METKTFSFTRKANKASRLVIPAKIRARLNLVQGDLVEVSFDNPRNESTATSTFTIISDGKAISIPTDIFLAIGVKKQNPMNARIKKIGSNYAAHKNRIR